jgi:hypothetical protein
VDGSRLARFRAAVVGCFGKARAALSDLCDALATAVDAQSLAELSESPFFRRRWSSIYKGLSRGRIDRRALQTVFAGEAPRPVDGERLVLALDASPMVRQQSRTAADRTLVHVPNLPAGAAPVLPGWQFSALVVVPDPASSWTHVLDNQRIPSTETAASVGAAQLRAVLPLLPARPILLADGGYGTAVWLQATRDLAVDQMVRIARNSVLYRAAPPPTGRRGRPRKDGAPFKCKDASTQGEPDDTWTGTDAQGLQVTIAVWRNLHLKACRAVTVTVVRRVALDPATPDAPPQTLWCIWVGETLPPLHVLASLYLRRFAIEHGYRFDKQDLLWTATRLRTPEQAQRWTDIVSVVHNLVGIARTEITADLRPWEPAHRPATPRQVRRALARIFADLGSPVPAPQPRGKSPGRAPGTRPPRAPRYPVIRKSPKQHKKRRLAA